MKWNIKTGIRFPFKGNSQCNDVTRGMIGKPNITRIPKHDFLSALHEILLLFAHFFFHYSVTRSRISKLDEFHSQQGVVDLCASFPLNSTGRHDLFLKLTCNMKPIDMGKDISDMTWTIS